MAKYALRAGAEIDLLTADELDTTLKKHLANFQADEREQVGETLVKSGTTFVTDASGNTSSLARGGGSCYSVPVGYDAFLTRFMVDYEGSNASATVSCDIRVVADQNTPSALRAIYNAVPSVYEASKSHAPLFRGGQHVVICITGGPHTTTMYATVQVLLVKRRPLHYDILDG